MEELEPLLARLVAIDSVSARDNSPVIELLESELRPLGFDLRRHASVDALGVEKQNLVAVRGPVPAHGPSGLALVGHTDTVPYSAAWKDALRLTRGAGPESDRLYGRGACDTKGFIACALRAVAAADLGALRAPLWLAFTADEETGCLGAKRLAELHALWPRHAIVGEPTSLTPVRAHKGYCLAEITVRGIEAHSAYPDRGASAIGGAGELLGDLEALARELEAKIDPAFDPPHTTINVGLISGGKAKNIIPGECRFTVEWRPLPGDAPGELPGRLRALTARLTARRPRLTCEVVVLREDGGAATRRDAELVRFLEAQSGRAAASVSFGTEAPELAALGAEPVVFGPGDIRVAHQTGEFVPMADLERCSQILGAAIEQFCR